MAFLTSGTASVRPAPAPALDAVAASLVMRGEWEEADFVLRFFPVFDFQRQAVAALFCTPMYARAGAEAIYGHKAFHDLLAEEWSAIDCAILEHALAFAERLATAGVVVGIGASVSFATLSDPRGRMMYRDALRGANARNHAALVLKIEDIPDRIGGQRIGEIVSSVRPLVPRVWAHLPGSHLPLSGQDVLHAAGVVLSMPARLPATGMAVEARWLSRVAQRQSALACMDHVDSGAELEAVRAANIRYAAGHALNCPALAAEATLDDIRDTLYGAGAQR
ncbi:MAG: hypothetical protein WDN03_17095 [Rhizomicrobium sp.]